VPGELLSLGCYALFPGYMLWIPWVW